MVVLALLSNEYPIAEIDCEEHAEAVAERLKGEETSAPLAGLLTLTPANAGIAARITRKEKRKETFLKVKGNENLQKMAIDPRSRQMPVE
jgi:hypothetical protein